MEKQLRIDFVTYLGWLDPDVVEFSGRLELFKVLQKANAVVHPNPHETLLYTDKLTDEVIVEIINETIEHIAPENYEDELEAISGGFLLQYGNEFIEPQCCTTIADALEWVSVLEAPQPEWQNIWIGHPWIHCRLHGNQIQLSHYMERNDDPKVRLSIPHNQFEKELEKAFVKWRAFRKRVRQLIDAGDYQHKTLLKKRLI